MHGRYIKDYLLCEQFISPMMLEPRAVRISILWAKICNTDRRRGREPVFKYLPRFISSLARPRSTSWDSPLIVTGRRRWAFPGTNASLPWQHTAALSPSKRSTSSPHMSQGSLSTVYPTLLRRRVSLLDQNLTLLTLSAALTEHQTPS